MVFMFTIYSHYAYSYEAYLQAPSTPARTSPMTTLRLTSSCSRNTMRPSQQSRRTVRQWSTPLLYLIIWRSTFRFGGQGTCATKHFICWHLFCYTKRNSNIGLLQRISQVVRIVFGNRSYRHGPQNDTLYLLSFVSLSFSIILFSSLSTPNFFIR